MRDYSAGVVYVFDNTILPGNIHCELIGRMPKKPYLH